MSFIVAIDGTAGTGKGTIADIIAKKYGFLNVDTGAMFRCVTLMMLKKSVSVDEEDKIKELLEKIQIEFKEENGEQLVFLNGIDVTKEIRTQEVNDIISEVSKIKIVRQKLLELQRNLAQGQNVVMEGRDIGTTVFPNANVKIFLDASPEERARRRVRQNEEKGIVCSYEEVLESVKNRDKIDSTRELSPLKKADDAIYIDGTNLNVHELEAKVTKIIEKQMKKEKIALNETDPIKKTKNVIKQYDKPQDSWWKKFQRRVIWNVLRGYYKTFYHVEVRGLENIPEDRPFILCGNHVEFIYVPVPVVFNTRKVNFIAKAELFKNPFLARLGRLFDVIPVKRGKQDVDSMKNSLKVLAKGEVLGLFPEGTRNGIAKKVKVKNGAAFMSLRTGHPLLPVGIKVEKSKIIINYGKLLDYSKYQSKTPEKEVLDNVTKELMDTIIDLTEC